MDALRPYLQPYTTALPPPLPSLLTNFLTPTCYRTLVLDLSLSSSSSTPCLRLLLSKLLGLGILTLSTIVKLPQILLLLRARSATGLSFPSVLLETAAYAVSLAYNVRMGWPFGTYGETLLIGVQDVAIGALVLGYGGKGAGMVGAWVVGVAALMGGLLREEVVGREGLGGLMAGAGALGVASKVPQIVQIWREGGTGQLSAFAVFTYLGGSLARVFTTLQEVDDNVILYGFVAGFLLNAVLAFQMVYYWGSSASRGSAQEQATVREKVPLAAGTGASSKAKGPTTRRRG